MEQATLTERLQLWNERVSLDSRQRLVRNVALAGGASKNGYQYTEEALRHAAKLYEEKPVFLDHASHPGRPRDRSTRDLVGSIVETRFEEGRIRGDIRVLGTEAGETFLKLVEAEAAGVGMSHVVLAERSSDGLRVERIVEVISVDVVINPATTSTFRESADETHEFSAAHPLSPAILESTTRELEQLRSRVALAERRERALTLLLESGLPPDVVTNCFREQLLSTTSEEACRSLLEDRRMLAMSSGRSCTSPRSLERQRREALPTDDLFLRALRRR